jgi:hypothetical protein
MKWPSVRLAVAAALFIAWLAWLAYLVLTASHPITLSRPQLLVSSLDAIARVDDVSGPESKVTIKEVYWPNDNRAQALEGKTIVVSNLAEAEGWSGPGDYLLPLMTDWKELYTVASTPPSPGYARGGRPRIYPANAQTLEQLKSISKPAAAPPAVKPG